MRRGRLRFCFSLALLLGCAAGQRPAVLPTLDDAAAIRRARAFFRAVDHKDTPAFRAMVGPGFFLFEDGSARSAAKLSRNWAKSRARGIKPRVRACSSERVRRSDNVVVYLADCRELIPAFGKRPASNWRGWNTLVMAPDARGVWKVVLWEWQASGAVAVRDRWNAAIRRGLFSKKPNALLVRVAATAKPGRALVLAMGQGRNAVYLAEQGWQVTGVDLSDEGVRRAKQRAGERKLAGTFTAVLADIETYDFGASRWDLITMIYAGRKKGWIRRAQRALKPGGLFVLEHFAPELVRAELAGLFAGWEIVENQVVTDVADWTFTRAPLVRFVARKR